MGCVNPDGTLSSQAQSILSTLGVASNLSEVAQKTGLPLYRVRAAVRELADANLVEEIDGEYRATSAGWTRQRFQSKGVAAR